MSLRKRLIRLAFEHPEFRGELLQLVKTARTLAVPVGATVESEHLRVHRYADSVRIWDLTNAGRRGKNVDILVVTDLDYLNGNDLAVEKFERWLGKAVGGLTFQETDRLLDGLISDLERSHTGSLPKVYHRSEKGVRVDPPQSVMRQIKMKVLDTPARTLSVEAKPSEVSIRETTFSVDESTGRRGPYLQDTVLANTKNKRETLTLYNWIVQNEAALKRARDLSTIQGLLRAEDVPYRIYYLD